jgi:L-threonylcarbamoyladenylate synthase
VSGTTAEHVLLSLGGKIELIIDGGPAQVGIESTVLDISGDAPRILRPGMIDAASILAVTGALADDEIRENQPLKSPGMLKKHYAPRAKLLMWSWENAESLCRQMRALREDPARIQILAHAIVPEAAGLGFMVAMPPDPASFAQTIYSQLHRCDAAGARYIIVEKPPETAEWRAIADRLKRAAA